MSKTYKYDRSSSRHRLRHVFLVTLSSVILVGIVAGLLYVGLHRDKPKTHVISGKVVLVPQSTSLEPMTTFDESTYTIKLPSDWKNIPNPDPTPVSAVSWQATIKDGSNRFLEVYVDKIPTTTSVNRELPLTADGNQLVYGELSDNCSNFTPGGTNNVEQAEQLKPAPSVWEGVNFLCDLPRVIYNAVGTGSSDGVNTISVTGPKDGTHQYFFLYTDLNIEPDYTILYNAITSFRAK